VAMVGRIGDDARGRLLKQGLMANGVDTEHLLFDPDTPTGVALIMVDATGEKQIMAAHGANRRLSPDDVRSASEVVAHARVLLVQLETQLETVLEAARITRNAGGRVILDPAPPQPLPDELLSLVDLVRANSSESEILTGVPITDIPSARRAASILMARGPDAAILQAGEEGALLVWSGGERFLPRIPVACIDATGAGDAFAAGLAVALAEGRSLPEAAEFANAVAALSTTSLGAQAGMPARAAVDAFVKG
jgi:ribokinase